MPTFAGRRRARVQQRRRGLGHPDAAALPGRQELSWHLINRLIADEFDDVTCQEMLVDHAITLPMALLWPEQRSLLPVAMVPVCINTVQFPLPTAARCYAGPGGGRARSSPGTATGASIVLGTGGLSHQLDGERAGFINPRFDQQFLQSSLSPTPSGRPSSATSRSSRRLAPRASS